MSSPTCYLHSLVGCLGVVCNLLRVLHCFFTIARTSWEILVGGVPSIQAYTLLGEATPLVSQGHRSSHALAHLCLSSPISVWPQGSLFKMFSFNYCRYYPIQAATTTHLICTSNGELLKYKSMKCVRISFYVHVIWKKNTSKHHLSPNFLKSRQLLLSFFNRGGACCTFHLCD